MNRIDIIAYVPDGTGGTVLGQCSVEGDFVWMALRRDDVPLQGCAPALVVEITTSDDDGYVRQITATPTGCVPDYKAWARKKRLAPLDTDKAVVPLDGTG